ncbi:MAG TPA: crossover junction endodeoxyribonuclease RuvC [Oligoflexia bacterium]|nr:crossover junction endodeoxyribonuclease RuvC [Oligoflexia bacterium]HMR25487.1 crossover junction endodeoxyribonuclease RuvC [Oligoflexia bacterium]
MLKTKLHTEKVLGIDPGSLHTGYGVLSQQGSRLIYIDSGVISPNKSLAFEQRLNFIYETLKLVMLKHQVTSVAVESIFYGKNVKSALILAHARAMALLLAAQHKLKVYEYSPLEVKIACTGYGRASKDQVASMIQHLFPKFAHKEKSKADESDALSVALCHLNTHPTLQQKTQQAISNSAITD